jgi:hypothetical protein
VSCLALNASFEPLTVVPAHRAKLCPPCLGGSPGQESAGKLRAYVLWRGSGTDTATRWGADERHAGFVRISYVKG